MVFYKESFGSLNDALKKTDGVAVLGVFVKAGKHNKEFDRWMRNFGTEKLDDCGSFSISTVGQVRLIHCTRKVSKIRIASKEPFDSLFDDRRRGRQNERKRHRVARLPAFDDVPRAFLPLLRLAHHSDMRRGGRVDSVRGPDRSVQRTARVAAQS